MSAVLETHPRKHEIANPDCPRWYDPTVGRWLSEDPTGLAVDADPYRYCGDRPTDSEDPAGLAPAEHLAAPRSDSKDTKYGKFSWDLTNTENNTRSGEINFKIAFAPNEQCPCKHIAFIQVVLKSTKNGKFFDFENLPKKTKEEWDPFITKDGSVVDRQIVNPDPTYGLRWTSAGGWVPIVGATKNGVQLGVGPGPNGTPAFVTDHPGAEVANEEGELIRQFATIAVCLDTGKVYGGLLWGYKVPNTATDHSVSFTGATKNDIVTNPNDPRLAGWKRWQSRSTIQGRARFSRKRSQALSSTVIALSRRMVYTYGA